MSLRTLRFKNLQFRYSLTHIIRPGRLYSLLENKFLRSRSAPQSPYRGRTEKTRSFLLPLKSGFDSSFIAFGLLLAGASFLIWDHVTGEPADSTDDPSHTSTPVFDSMGNPIPEGFKGNLTPEHEERLKEFWEALLKIAGVNIAKNGDSAENGTSSKENGNGAVRKKKRFGLFKRGGGEDPANAEDTEDKYGQTKEFKQALADQSPEELRRTIWAFTKMDDPDAIILRYLRARKWNVQNALIMLVSTNHWRQKEIHLDDEILATGEAWFADKAQNGSGDEKKLGEDVMAQFRMGKSYIHGIDKEGRPVSWVRVRLHKGGEQSVESMEKFTVYMIETCRLMLGPDPPQNTGVIVFDMTDFSMANMDYTPVKFMIKCFEANYPECLGAICVYKAPWIFHGIWAIIKGWLDPVVASKIHFAKDVHELSDIIPVSRIPHELGGDEDWTYSYVEPISGENSAMADESRKTELMKERWQLIEEYEAATLKWCYGEGDEKEVSAKRSELVEGMKANYWKLDPFVRAKTMYDRLGIIRQGGHIDMYPEDSRAAKTSSRDGVDDVD